MAFKQNPKQENNDSHQNREKIKLQFEFIAFPKNKNERQYKKEPDNHHVAVINRGYREDVGQKRDYVTIHILGFMQRLFIFCAKDKHNNLAALQIDLKNTGDSIS